MEQRGPTPKQLVLRLLSASSQREVPVRGLLRAGEILGISSNHIRVTCTRLKLGGLIEPAGRGFYQLGPEARSLQREVGAWRDLESRLESWDGGWMAVHTAGLGRADRKRLRQRERSLRILGFRELSRGLEFRPHNLVGGVEGIRLRLQKLGLESNALVFRLTHLDKKSEEKAPDLWRTKELNRSYSKWQETLRKVRTRALEMPFERAARELYLVGNEAIRSLVFDPLLPEPFVDTAARAALLEATIAFDELGRRVWEQVLGIDHNPEREGGHRGWAGLHPAPGILGEWHG